MQVELRASAQQFIVGADRAVIRKGMQSILGVWPGWQISGEAANAEEAVQLTKDLKPDIVLMDIRCPGWRSMPVPQVTF